MHSAYGDVDLVSIDCLGRGFQLPIELRHMRHMFDLENLSEIELLLLPLQSPLQLPHCHQS
jgi:hypothetical protein